MSRKLRKENISRRKCQQRPCCGELKTRLSNKVVVSILPASLKGEGRNPFTGKKYVGGEHVEKESKSVHTALGKFECEESRTR